MDTIGKTDGKNNEYKCAKRNVKKSKTVQVTKKNVQKQSPFFVTSTCSSSACCCTSSLNSGFQYKFTF